MICDCLRSGSDHDDDDDDDDNFLWALMRSEMMSGILKERKCSKQTLSYYECV